MGNAEDIKVDVKGNVSGQMAVGSYILQIGNMSGGVVNAAPPSNAPAFTRRPSPVNLRPRPFQGLLDRETEFTTLKEALQSSTPVSVFGDGGIGKTSFLRQLAHIPEVDGFADGVVFLDVTDLALGDLLQSLFDAFYESSASFKPTDAEIQTGLKDVHALVILDDLGLARDEVTTLLDAAPQCQFVLASNQRSLWGEGKLVPLGGLPEQDAIALFEGEAGRAFSEPEREQVKALSVLLKGHPLQLLQAASLIRERNLPISDLLRQMNGQQPEQVVVTSLVNILTETQKRILAILAASDGATISLDHLLSLTSDPDAQKAARGLVELGLVQAHSPRYSLKGDLVVSLAAAWDLSSWENTLINYFVNWVTQQPSQMLMEESAEALIRVVKKAEEKKRWSEVISIGRGLEKTYALWKRWQSWSDILNIILKAAKALGDKKVEGWVLHQLGTRAMCLGLADQGRALLSQALNIRRVIGDKAGLALTQHNLNLLMGIPIPIKGGQSGCRRYLGCGCGAVGGIGVLVALAVAVLLLFPGSPPATPVPYYVDTDTPFPTVTDTSTPKPFLTLTPSSTPRPTITPTSTPSVLYDFVENANKAQWYMYYADYSGNAIVGYDQATGVKFFEELPSYNPDQYVTQLGQSYAGWERKPVFTDGSFAPLVVLAYPYCSSEGCYNLKLGGFYDLSYLTLGENDYLTLKTGYRLPPPATLDEGEAFIYDGVTFRIAFYENDPQTAILLGSLTQTNDGTIKDWTVPIPPELAGKSGWFLLEVDPGPYSYLDWSTWAEAQLIRP